MDTAVNYMVDGDILLLIEDGVYAAIKGGAAASKLEGCSVSVLAADIAARGIAAEKLIDGVSVVDYAGFVDMVEANEKVQSWL
jgi:tRNA 2-thiouridine synthesizing protein B